MSDKQISMRSFFFALPLLATAAFAQNTTPDAAQFPFAMPWDDATKTIVSVADLNPAPLEAKHRVVVREGHFFDQTNRRVRFLGVNFAFAANFPEKADAEKIAARLHKFGVNCVRFHHMDTAKAPRGLWDAKAKGTQQLDAAQLDRLDYLVAQFKKNGIYVDLNLHVGRELGAADGFTDIPETLRAFRYSKVLSYFEPRMIALQKKYATDLLTRKNPYTGLTYADEPTVALIEINNEDTLLGAAWGDTLQTMPEPYRSELRRQWNEWLRQRYGTDSKLLAAWNANAQPLGDNLLPNEDAPAVTDWTLENRAAAPLKTAVDEVANAPQDMPHRALRVEIPPLEATERPRQLHRLKLDLKEGQSYTLRFWAKADKPRQLRVDGKIHQDPWTNIGFNQLVQLTGNWKLFTVRFAAQRTVPGVNRVSFIPGYESGTVWLAGVTLRPGSELQLSPGESLAQNNLDIPALSSTPQGEDFARFLMGVEYRYASGMKAHIQRTLGAKALVTCSQASYGGIGGVWREAQMDFVDMHAYWQHPQFPRKPWDPEDWKIPNISLTKAADGGTLARLASHRVAEMPFTVSEYNHPAPNDFAAEGLPLLAAFAAWQDWDGIFLYSYAHSVESMKSDKINSYFDGASNPSKMALLPAAARLFLTGTASPAPQKTLMVPREQIAALATAKGRDLNNLWLSAAAKSRDLVEHRTAVTFTGNDLRLDNRGANDGPIPTKYWQWDSAQGLVKIARPDAPALIGFFADKAQSAADFTARLAAPGFAVLTLSSLDGKATRDSSSLLLTAMNRAENSGMQWNQTRDSVGKNWGSGPVQITGVSGEIALATKAQTATVYALDATGARAATVPCQVQNGTLTFRIEPAQKTVWYEIAAR